MSMATLGATDGGREASAFVVVLLAALEDCRAGGRNLNRDFGMHLAQIKECDGCRGMVEVVSS